MAELPAFVDFLLNWRIPVELQSERYGISHYHHPVILRAIDEMAPETRLLDLIDAHLFCGGGYLWEGGASELRKLLSDHDRYATEQLLHWPPACATYLARLAKKMPDRVVALSSKYSHHAGKWRIANADLDEWFQ